jgi:Ca2+-binding RTX toxin-like protein
MPINGDNNPNILNGTGGDDFIYGAGGNDTLYGAAGDDALYGGDDNDTIYGGDGADLLHGGAGADTLIGGTGNDVYAVDNAGDVVTEAANEGTDTVKTSINYTLGANVENVQLYDAGGLTVHGNSLGNSMQGDLTGGDNIYGEDGNDSIYGFGGDDNLYGGTGNDVLNGGDGSDLLDGGTGNDNMAGGNNDDTYVVDAAGDVVNESGATGNDLVASTVSFTLGTNVENLQLQGSANINGTGNELDNIIRGNDGNNVITGGAGHDSLYGGAGADTFVLDAPNGTSSDGIHDFVSGTDSIQVAHSDYAGIAVGTLTAGDFVNNGVFAATANHAQFIFYSNELYFDADGTGAGGPVQIAGAISSLAASDIHVV